MVTRSDMRNSLAKLRRLLDEADEAVEDDDRKRVDELLVDIGAAARDSTPPASMLAPPSDPKLRGAR